jgi:hypothetical protein
MWDQGTHDVGMEWPQATAEFMKEIGADGINGDTQDGVPFAFSLAADKIGHPFAFEPVILRLAEDGPATVSSLAGAEDAPSVDERCYRSVGRNGVCGGNCRPERRAKNVHVADKSL